MLATWVANCSMLKGLQMDTNYFEKAISLLKASVISKSLKLYLTMSNLVASLTMINKILQQHAMCVCSAPSPREKDGEYTFQQKDTWPKYRDIDLKSRDQVEKPPPPGCRAECQFPVNVK